MTRSITNEKKRQRVFALREKGLSYAKIAKAVDISVPTVGLWVRNAKPLTKKLRNFETTTNPGYNRAATQLKTVSNASLTIGYAKKALEAFEALIGEIA